MRGAWSAGNPAGYLHVGVESGLPVLAGVMAVLLALVVLALLDRRTGFQPVRADSASSGLRSDGEAGRLSSCKTDHAGQRRGWRRVIC